MISARTLLITGGAWWSPSGPVNIGHHAIRELLQSATRPYTIYLCTRHPPQPSTFPDFLASLPRPAAQPLAHTLNYLPLDLASPKSIKACARAFLDAEPGKKLDVLLLNAGMVPGVYDAAVKLRLGQTPGPGSPTSGDAVGEEIESSIMVNALGHALLVECLWSALRRDATAGEVDPVRIVTVGSELHRRVQERVSPETLDSLIGPAAFQSMTAYKVSKLVETHLAFILQDRLGKDGVSLAVSPGFLPATSLSRTSAWPLRLAMRYIMPWLPFAASVEDGGRRVADAIVREVDAAAETGKDGPQTGYLKDFAFAPAADDCYDLALRAEWRTWFEERVAALQALEAP